MKKRKTDCEVLSDGVGDVFSTLGDCFDTAFDEKKTKTNVVGSIFGFGKALTKLSFNAGVCAIKNTPKAVATVAAAKRDVVEFIEDEVNTYQKQAKIDALDEKIKNLKLKPKGHL